VLQCYNSLPVSYTYILYLLLSSIYIYYYSHDLYYIIELVILCSVRDMHHVIMSSSRPARGPTISPPPPFPLRKQVLRPRVTLGDRSGVESRSVYCHRCMVVAVHRRLGGGALRPAVAAHLAPAPHLVASTEALLLCAGAAARSSTILVALLCRIGKLQSKRPRRRGDGAPVESAAPPGRLTPAAAASRRAACTILQRDDTMYVCRHLSQITDILCCM
jgi:hypothetical protein